MKSFLSITDLHFNSCYDPSLLEKLGATEPENWNEVFESSSIKTLSPHGQDTNYPLLKSWLADLKSRPDVDFILFSGDFLGHRLREQFQAGSKDQSDAAFKSFIQKTVRFLANQFQETFPEKVIFPAMGNDDNICGDYEITPMGDFLEVFTESWRPIMDRLAGPTGTGQSSFADTFPIGGYYTASLPGLPGRRLIVLNNIFMSQNYRDVCGKMPGDPALAQLSWLEWVLYRSRAQNEKVWMIFHEPIGINIYPVLHGKDPLCANNVQTFMKSKYGDALREQLIGSADLIQAAFCGHTHMDEFRILHDDNNKPLMYMHVTPSVSPVFGNNPAYQVFTIDSTTRAPADYTTRMLDLTQSQDPALVRWEDEYQFSKTYGQAELTPQSLNGVRDSIASDNSIRENYIKYYAVGSAKYSPINQNNWKAFYDIILDNTSEEFVEDYCPPHQSSLLGRTLETNDD